MQEFSFFSYRVLVVRSSKQLELEEKLELMAKRHSEQLAANAKLQSELLQKENVISAQGEEGSQWRDKVRAAESEVAKFKTLVDDKEKEISNLKDRIKTFIQDVSSKDNRLNEALELIKSVDNLLLITQRKDSEIVYSKQLQSRIGPASSGVTNQQSSKYCSQTFITINCATKQV